MDGGGADALGSGIALDAAGDIVTNNHVVSGASSFTVTTASGKRYPAKLVGSFPPDDLAVIKVSGARLSPQRSPTRRSSRSATSRSRSATRWAFGRA